MEKFTHDTNVLINCFLYLTEQNHLDSVESTEKLNHPTANRARAPTRRLPSSIHGKEQPVPQAKQVRLSL